METFFQSIKGRLIITGSLCFVIAASAALYAILRFVDSAESLNNLTKENLTVIEHARQMDQAVNLFSQLVSTATKAGSVDDYEEAYDNYSDAWEEVQHHAQQIPERYFEQIQLPLSETIDFLDRRLIDLDSTLLRLLEFREAETRLFAELREDLDDMRRDAQYIKEESGLNLNLTFADLLSAKNVEPDDLQKLVDEDFVQFQYSLEIDVTLSEILNVLNRLPFLTTDAEIAEARETFEWRFITLRRNFNSMGLVDDAATDTLSSLQRWGREESNIFDQRLEMLEIESELQRKRAQLVGVIQDFEIASRKLSTTVVDTASNEITKIEETVEESVYVTIVLLSIALLVAAGVGWRIVLNGIVAPLNSVEFAMRRIAGGNVDTELPAGGKDELGSMVSALGTLRDFVVRVTEAETQVREGQARLQGILDNSPALIWIIDPERRYVVINNAYAKALGKKEDELVGRPVSDFMNPESEAKFAEVDRHVMATGETITREDSVPFPSGIRTFFAAKFPIRNANGETAFVGGIGTDITELKEAEQKLSRKETQLRSALDNMAGGIFMCDDQLTITLYNQKFVKLFDYPQELLQEGCTLYDLWRFKAKMGERWATSEDEGMTDLEKPFKSGRHEVFERKLKSGKTIEMSVAPMEEGGIVCIASDVTERREAEEVLKENLNELEQFNQLAVGRELRMIELKQEINQVLESVGKKPAYEVVE